MRMGLPALAGVVVIDAGAVGEQTEEVREIRAVEPEAVSAELAGDRGQSSADTRYRRRRSR